MGIPTSTDEFGQDLKSNLMTSENYVENVLRTESIDFDAIRERLYSEDVVTLLRDGMGSVIGSAEFLDKLKKHIFYGKKLDVTINPDKGQDLNFYDIKKRIADDQKLRLLHAGMGLVTEAGEFMEMLEGHLIGGKDLDLVNLKEEVGDSQWYAGIAIDVLKTTLNEILTVNIEKLRKRYPDKFTNEAAINRDTDAEREILEQ